MYVLGIDTILHDFCVAVTKDNKVLSSIVVHRRMSDFRGELLRLPLLNIQDVGKIINLAIKKAKINLTDISLISVNNKGSLFSNIIIGITSGNLLSEIYGIPIVEVEHQAAHIFSNWINKKEKDKISFPVIVFSASGGHTSINLIKKNNFKYQVLYDNSGIENKKGEKPNFLGVGTLFSDMAIILGFEKSKKRNRGNGNLISGLAKRGRENKYDFFGNYKKENNVYDFNFLNIRKYILSKIKKKLKANKTVSLQKKADIALGFENFISDIIIENVLFWVKKHKAKEVHFVGGVSANSTLRKKVKKIFKKREVVLRIADKKYCTDNGGMISVLGFYKYINNKNKYKKQRKVKLESDFKLEKIAIDQFFNKPKRKNI